MWWCVPRKCRFVDIWQYKTFFFATLKTGRRWSFPFAVLTPLNIGCTRFKNISKLCFHSLARYFPFLFYHAVGLCSSVYCSFAFMLLIITYYKALGVSKVKERRVG